MRLSEGERAVSIVPRFPLIEEPGQWDDLTLVAATAFLEAEGEPFSGILGVCWVIRRRAVDWKLGWRGAILGGDGLAYGDGKPYEALSAWDDDYRVRARARLSEAAETVREPFWKASAAAIWELLPDPVAQSAYYLNVAVTLKIRGGTLPAWAADPVDPKKINGAKVAAVIGRHTFVRA